MILVVISPYEREAFQVDAALAVLSGADIQFFICKDYGAECAGWPEVLSEVRPEILVVGWACPALPEVYLEAKNCTLRYVCFLTGSVRRLVPRIYLENGGKVTNWGDAAAPLVAEHALLLLLATLRRLTEWRPFFDLPFAEQNLHPMPVATSTLHGRQISLHGFGQIARQLIRLLAPFGVKIRAFSEGVPAEYMRTHGAEPVGTIVELFGGADILVECEALTPLTLGSVTADLIKSLAENAIFVNVGRGAVVDEVALAQRAKEGNLHLALDVLTVEPMPADSPFRQLPNVLISPHIGGPTKDQLPHFGLRVAANIQRYLAGEPLQQSVSLEIYDRST